MTPNLSSNNPSRGRLKSLYSNYLDTAISPSSPALASLTSIGDQSHQDEPSVKKQLFNAAALRFQPTKRPSQKPKLRTSALKSHSPMTPSVLSTKSPIVGLPAPLSSQSSLATWTAPTDIDDLSSFYAGEKRQRGGRKKRKKVQEAIASQNWDDIYDPSRPNNYDEYKCSDEKLYEIRDWKDTLYAHRRARKPTIGLRSSHRKHKTNNHFAPPLNYSFAPPHLVDENPTTNLPVPSIPTKFLKGIPGEDAHTLKLLLPSYPIPALHPPNLQEPSPSTTISPPPPAMIVREPVRYNCPSTAVEIPALEAEYEDANTNNDLNNSTEDLATSRSLRPGQRGFAKRLMTKYGWTKGTGLGVDSSGIINPLRVQLEKQKKKPESEGGGFLGSSGRGKIIGGQRRGDGNAGSVEDKFGPMSEVVILQNMVDGMDLEEEFHGALALESGLVQEIGDECAEKYGRVERVFIHRYLNGTSAVFVKFTSQLSGLRAVNALEGRIFAGNTIVARFFDTKRFDAGIYE
ncbi:MAG: hypothetical protein M1829_002799 [Trizodia sp. TS-e1964]|nr:MAG: hypothetical protein M1829_002799 [Trizodia sp. TS-e1964]